MERQSSRARTTIKERELDDVIRAKEQARQKVEAVLLKGLGLYGVPGGLPASISLCLFGQSRWYCQEHLDDLETKWGTTTNKPEF